MKKRYYAVANVLLSSLITMLGLGACKSSSKPDDRGNHRLSAAQLEEEKARQLAEAEAQYMLEQERLRKVQEEEKEKKRRLEEIKVVYGPPVARNMPEVTPNPDSDGVYDIAEIMPQFPGGDAALIAWLKENIRYPQKAREEGISGRVVVTFIVRANGTIDGAKVVKSVDPNLDAEALRLVKSMPKWTPGKVNGLNAAVKYTIPIVFRP